YMSPEQACQREFGPASDWYSVGVVLYQVLTGKLPFVGRPQAVLSAKQERDPPDPRSMIAELPGDLCDLCMRLLSRDPEKRPNGTEVLALLGAKSSQTTGHPNVPRTISHFVGRVEHLETLHSQFELVRDGQGPQCVCIHGAPGIGKSALMETFSLKETIESGAVVLAGRCYERESVPFKAMDTIVDSLSRYLCSLSDDAVGKLLPEFTQPLSRLFPVLRTVPAVAKFQRTQQPLDPLELRRRALIGLREVLSAIAESSPLLVRVDDFQWGDKDSAILLVSLLEPPSPPNMLLCISYRSDDREGSSALHVLHKRLRGMGLRRRVHMLEVLALRDQEVEELAQSRMGSTGDAAQSDMARRVAKESRGNPFFVEEMCRYLQREGRAPAEGVEALSLEDTIMARFSDLSIQQRRLLEVVAIAGTPLPEDIALHASCLAGRQKDVGVLRVGRLLRSNREGVVARLESYHDRIREVLVANVSNEQCQKVNHNLALAFESLAPGDCENIAGFFARAGLFEEASPHAKQAAEKAASSLAFERAALYFRMALKAPQEKHVAQEMLVELASALSNAGKGVEAAEAYLNAAKTAAPATALDLRRQAADNLLRAGHVDEAVATFKGVLATVGLSFAKTSRRSLANLLWWRMTLRIRGVHFKPREVSDIAPGTLLKVAVCGSCALGFGMNDPIRGAEFQTRHFLLALRSGEPSRVGRAMALEGVYRALEGAKSRSSAEKLILTARTLGESSGDPVVAAFATSAQALVHYQNGEWKQALSHFDESANIYLNQCRGHQSVACQAERLAVDTLYALGDMAELSRRVPAILRAADDRGDLHGITDMRTGLPNCHWLVQDRVEQARADCVRGEKQWSERSFFLQHYYSALASIQIELYDGHGAAALERFETMWPKLKRSMLLRVPVVRTQASWLYGRALVAAAAARVGSERKTLVSQARRVAGRLGSQSITNGKPFATLLRAQCDLLDGKVPQALASLGDEGTAFGEIDMKMCEMITLSVQGKLLGGEAGAQLIAQCQEWMSSQGVVNPDSFSRMLIPIRDVRVSTG
ncbi:MAG: AAA family ATPase, partial [Kofleriaceae bacterium]|nr:AAA family ATPase [Kofleriaceae bacterium]